MGQNPIGLYTNNINGRQTNHTYGQVSLKKFYKKTKS